MNKHAKKRRNTTLTDTDNRVVDTPPADAPLHSYDPDNIATLGWVSDDRDHIGFGAEDMGGRRRSATKAAAVEGRSSAFTAEHDAEIEPSLDEERAKSSYEQDQSQRIPERGTGSSSSLNSRGSDFKAEHGIEEDFGLRE
jgi:hypothetical protein